MFETKNTVYVRMGDGHETLASLKPFSIFFNRRVLLRQYLLTFRCSIRVKEEVRTDTDEVKLKITCCDIKNGRGQKWFVRGY